ncbi:unnamed protein product [Camellia sinensis]
MPRERVRCPSENRNNSGEEVPISEKKTLRFNGSLSLGHNYVNDLNSARFLWKSIKFLPRPRKAGPQVVAREARDVVASFSEICAAMGLECGLNFSNANCEKPVCCDGTEIRSQQIAQDFKDSQICPFYWINSFVSTVNKGDVEAFHALQ